jgi:hypothetical protein
VNLDYHQNSTSKYDFQNRTQHSNNSYAAATTMMTMTTMTMKTKGMGMGMGMGMSSDVCGARSCEGNGCAQGMKRKQGVIRDL